MSFKEYLKEKEESLAFPTDEKIKDVANQADEAFWKIVVEAFKNKLESKEFKPSKELELFKLQQFNAIKEWIKSNWKDLDEPEININIQRGSYSLEPTAFKTNSNNEPSTGSGAVASGSEVK